MPKLSIIIPCYFNEANIPVTMQALVANEARFPAEVTFEYVLVDDASGDGTVAALHTFQRQYPERVKVVELAANVGSYNAIVAGMAYATGDCNVIITADLQDPPELMAAMYAYWQQGFPLVIGNRQDRQEGAVSVLLAKLFHSLMRRFALRNIPPGGFDYVLFDRQVREQVVRLQERNSNVFYLMTWLGYPYVNLPYSRRRREIGTSRWTLSKKVKLFLDSFLSFSFFPIRAISVTGICLGAVALLYGLYLVALRLSGTAQPAGWTMLMVVLLFVSAFQMMALGIIGEYVWRGLDAARNRPLYVVKAVREPE
ncbi:dolichol-phosphate mannosyltransferase [Hymenobacter luteus]|uniref:Dolichol-phosphate mannosyltransferase n=2 Tax=Hymenobacter TaxID=89966 RepID=A0A7W9T088_9BACT|nr:MULTISPECIES: glycosyltransferase family 2 protein [Hymenobacter]MBB4600602.1 dolichol-phosphate mannosyltransferase [Hymenobacter latericoloratus]MBB6059191.1 dolichol-phosphate mannosyltransferase [Hymenobacter luteus]